MPITRHKLAERIRAAREACGLTQKELAKHLGFSRPTVVQIEAGKRAVSSLELDKIAYLFGRDIREFIAESFDEEDALAVLFRAQPAVAGQPVVMEKLRECLAIGRELTNLEQIVGIDRSQAATASYPLPPSGTRWQAIQQGERLADEERRRLGLGNAPLPPLIDLLESQGVRTGVVDLPEDISGLTLSDRKGGLFVFANRAHHCLRRRFSIAHEYAHVIADRDRIGIVSRASERDDLLEVRSNAFAAAFLMPEEGVRQFVTGLGKGRPSRSRTEVFDEAGSLDVEGRTEPGSQSIQLYDLVQAAHHFEVSRLMALFRLRNLRLLNDAEFNSLKVLDDKGTGKELAKAMGLDDPDSPEIRNEFRHRFLGLALEAYRRDEISRGKLKELVLMVGLSADEIDRLIENVGLAADPGKGPET